jgi:SHS family sialic acid transporter-like MFS transporter
MATLNVQVRGARLECLAPLIQGRSHKSLPESLPTMDQPPDSLSRGQRWLVLAAAFLAWAFAGQAISLYILIHRQLVIGLLEPGLEESVITSWFAWFQAAFLFGAATGGWALGWLGDRVGRVRSLSVSVLCYSLFTFAAYFATSLEQHLVLRFLACLGIGGAWPGAVALVSEAWPEASRPLLAGLLGAAANFGFVFLGVLAYLIPVTDDAWRWPLLVGTAPAVLGVLIFLIVPESPSWRNVTEASTPVSPLREVFSRPLLGHILLGIGLGAVPVVGTAANANWLIPWTDQVAQQQSRTAVRGDARSKALTQITRSSGAILGSFFGGLLASFLGRRLSYFLISLCALMLSSILFGWLDPLHAWFHAFVFLFGLVGVTYFGWLPLFLPELFPTRVRATGTGISFNSGRVVAGIVVLSSGTIVQMLGGDYARIGLGSGLIYIVGMAIIWLAPARPVDTAGD